MNRREKILLSLLALIAAGFLFYNFIYLANQEKLASKEIEVAAKKEEAERILNAVNMEKDLNFELQSLNFEVSNMTEPYLAELDQENAILFFNRYFEAYDLSVTSLNFSQVALSSMTYDPNPPATSTPNYPLLDLKEDYLDIESNGIAEKELQPPRNATAESLTVSFDFQGDYYDWLDFLDFLQTNQIEFVLSNMAMSSNEDGTVSGNTAVSLYSIPKLHDHEQMDWVWSDVIEYGRANPFYLDDVILDPYWTTRYDLTLVLSPMELDIPTVNLGRYRDDTYQSYVYADSNTFEDVQIEVAMEEGQYLMRYRTLLGTHPDNYSNWVPFEPANDFISLQVLSMVRQSASDQGGINLTIINETDLLFYINVFEDDPIYPRLNLVTQDNVVVNFN